MDLREGRMAACLMEEVVNYGGGRLPVSEGGGVAGGVRGARVHGSGTRTHLQPAVVCFLTRPSFVGCAIRRLGSVPCFHVCCGVAVP